MWADSLSGELDHSYPLPSDTMGSSLLVTQEKLNLPIKWQFVCCRRFPNSSWRCPMVVHGETDPHLSLPSTRHFPLYDKLPLLPSFITEANPSAPEFYSQHSAPSCLRVFV